MTNVSEKMARMNVQAEEQNSTQNQNNVTLNNFNVPKESTNNKSKYNDGL
eukprot:CAMPEP_0116968624 /NCGR_PEP_ID=MMETSP0467-20121206/51354_1 /TAXON_ID=283647 /ORGANISM="Mesodinium pulex, Strain SPMC105" /LENGTH=49 /DNA_ID=CAMNT_0004658953 /DNA_START=167 /DNA_END=316 /DNA_ORIENTATION=+